MMAEVYSGLFVGDMEGCTAPGPVVHACKHPCHRQAVGYAKHLSPSHPSYLIHRPDERSLVLNMIDAPVPMFPAALFTAFLEFAVDHYRAGGRLTVHCNLGESRAPSLAMLFLAKRVPESLVPGDLPGAMTVFGAMYRAYQPSAGILTYLRQHWEEI